MLYEIHLQSKNHDEMIDITAQVEKLLAQGTVQEGLVVVYSSGSSLYRVGMIPLITIMPTK
jgi:thiamine phosphate synthase YjbQ (UPF0047 family)